MRQADPEALGCSRSIADRHAPLCRCLLPVPLTHSMPRHPVTESSATQQRVRLHIHVGAARIRRARQHTRLPARGSDMKIGLRSDATRGRRLSRDVARAVTLGLMATSLVACGSVLVRTRVDAKAHGAVISMPERPSPPECAALIRADLPTAVAVRSHIGIDAVEASNDAAGRAAADPMSVDVPFGVPLTSAESVAVQAAIPVPESTTALLGIIAAHPSEFSMIWLDRETPVVSVLQPDPTVLRLARCLESRVPARYVTAGVPAAVLTSLGDRIDADRGTLAREGITVTIVETDTRLETVTVGVSGMTPTIERTLVDRYGTVVHVIESPGAHPASP